MCFINTKRQALARPNLVPRLLSKSKPMFLQNRIYKKEYNCTKFSTFVPNKTAAFALIK